MGCRTVLRRPPGSWRLAAREHLLCGGLVLPVLVVAASHLAVAAVSGLAKRPRSGLALTRWTRPRSSCSEEDEPQLVAHSWPEPEAAGDVVSAQRSRPSGSASCRDGLE